MGKAFWKYLLCSYSSLTTLLCTDHCHKNRKDTTTFHLTHLGLFMVVVVYSASIPERVDYESVFGTFEGLPSDLEYYLQYVYSEAPFTF